jgi:hypothetical protein
MRSVQLYIFFHKSTLAINWSFSLSFSILLFFLFQLQMIYSFSAFSMTLGFFLSLLINDYSFANKEIYYFYYNQGITKTKLIVFSSILNLLFSLILIIGYSYGKQFINS